MTRHEQYDAFLPFFKAEDQRYSALTQRATAFLGLISIISLFGGLNVSKVPSGVWPHASAIATATLILFAVLSALAALWIRSYRDICDLEEFVVLIDEEKYEEEDIYSLLLANMADAVGHNRSINDRRARWLEFSATFFALSIACVAITSLLTIKT